MARHLMLISDADKTCGVEEFARQTARRMGPDTATAVLGRALPAADEIILNLPIVAWKKRLVAPIVAAALARRKKRQVTIILHEWADLALARRISYLPLLPLATRILFSSPEVMQQFAATPISAICTKVRAVIPIPPNFTLPERVLTSPLSRGMAVDRAKGKLVVAQFGSIYPKKDPLVLLDVAAELVRRDIDVSVVFIGSFVGETIEIQFWSRVDALQLRGRVHVTGYIAAPEELYGLFGEVDVFLYPLSEGLTSRRASVLATALSGRPVVVSTPERPDSLAHHSLFKALVEAGALQFVPRAANASAMADAVLAARGTTPSPIDAEASIESVWRDLVATIEA